MKRDLLLWITILAGPIAWFISMEANFALAPWVCQWQSRVAPNLVSILALLLVASFGFLARREWTHLRSNAGDPQSVEARPRAMAIGGTVLSGLFFIVILAQAFPHWMLNGCQ